MKLPKPQEGFAQYQGAFSSPAFGLLAGNPLFHANLFRALASATPQNLKKRKGLREPLLWGTMYLSLITL